MYLSCLLTFMAATVGSLGASHVYPPSGPSNVEEFREMYPYNPGNLDKHKKVVTIHPSEHDLDDVSTAFYKGLKEANNGGTLYLPAQQTFVIGKSLDLTFLNNIQ